MIASPARNTGAHRRARVLSQTPRHQPASPRQGADQATETRIENVGKYQSCMVSKLPSIWKEEEKEEEEEQGGSAISSRKRSSSGGGSGGRAGV